MKPFLATLLCAFLLVSVGCKAKPKKIYESAIKAKQKKDKVKFLKYFTKDSRELIVKLLELGKKGDMYKYLKTPWVLLPYDKVSKVKIDEELEIATLTVNKKGEAMKVIMVKEGGEWRIDGRQLPTLVSRTIEML